MEAPSKRSSGSMVISLRSNGCAQSNKSFKGHKKAVRKIKKSQISQGEKDEKLRKLDADWETILNRKTLTPKTQFGGKSVPIEVGWPDVHAEMDLSELIAARKSLTVTLLSVFKEHNIGFYKDADSACTALLATVTVLRSLIKFSEDRQKEVIPESLYNFAVTHMENAVEVSTCKMLDPRSPQHSRRGGGRLLMRIEADAHWESIKNRISNSIQEVRRLAIIGDMLIKGFRAGEWGYVKGVLEILQIYEGVEVKDDNTDDARRTYLLTKQIFLDRSSKLQSLHIRAPNYYIPLASSENFQISQSTSTSNDDIRVPSLNTPGGSGQGHHQKMFPPIPRIHEALDCSKTQLNSITPHGPKRPQERVEKRYREQATCEDSDSTTDEDEDCDTHIQYESSKRLKLNLNKRLLSYPEPGPSRMETLEVREVRMEIEGVHICEGEVTGLQGLPEVGIKRGEENTKEHQGGGGNLSVPLLLFPMGK